MPVAITINKKPAEVTTPGGFDFVLTTTLTFDRNSDHDFIQYRAARVQH